ncbi:hypothetical protein GCM10022271_26610 [Corallibacter vietnamensis]|uniref:Fibronectin type-III domain-containing protein n=1 Tax=Corallibacter vietnamensis TaxID=904130 RepID=A0ABP7HNB8_9FLAO
MKKIILLLTILLLIFTGCNKDDESPQGQTTPQTFIKEQSEIMSVSTNSITLTGSQNEIESNDIIVSGANSNAPFGFLRKVTSKSNSNGNTILQTQRVALSEAVKYYYEEGEEFNGSTSYTFQPSDLSGRNSNQNNSVPITIPIDETITTTQGGVPIEINLSGDLTITPSIDFDISISNNNFSPNIEEFLFSISTENDFNVSITTQVDVSFDTDDIELGSFTGAPITITVGIPVVIIPKFTLYIGANGDLNASIVYTYSNNSTAISGVTYDNGWQFLPENGFSVNSQNATATASVSGNAKAYIKPEFSLSLYDDDFVSSGINVEPYARFEGSITSTQYNWLINGGIDTGAFFKAQAFGFSLVDEEWNNLINIPEWEIASGGYDIATITNPVPTDNATVTTQPITFSWQPNDFTVTPNYEILLGTDVNALNIIGTTSNTSFEYTNNLSNDTYYWKVIARDSNNDIITESLIFSFILNESSSVAPAHTPNPTNGSTNIALNGNLSFTEGANTPTDATFKVYFDTNTNPTTVYNLDANTNTLNYSNLQEGTQYYWYVETISSTNTVLATSPIWNFTTLTNTANTDPATNPTPNDGATNVTLVGNLSFTEGANTPTDATYRLYFDTNTNPTTQFDLGSQTSYSYSNLQENTTYYWYVETVSNTNTVLATSPIWGFTTESNTSGGIYTGNVTLNSQTEVNNFAANNYTQIIGNLTVISTNTSDPINSLVGFSSLTGVDGVLTIDSTFIINLDGFNSLSSVVTLDIKDNDNLQNINALSSLTTVNQDLRIYRNQNNSFVNIDGLSSLTFIGDDLSISANSSLNNIDGLSSVQSIGGYFKLGTNESLININGLSSVQSIGEYITINNNQLLTNLCGISLVINNGFNGNYNVYDNGYNPTMQDIIDGNCSQ